MGTVLGLHFSAKLPYCWPKRRACYDGVLWSPWLVRLGGLGDILQRERSRVGFRVREHAWVAIQVLGEGRATGNRLTFLSHTSVSLPLFLLPFPSPYK